MKALPLILILLCGCSAPARIQQEQTEETEIVRPQLALFPPVKTPSVVNPPPIPVLIQDASDINDWHVIFPAGAVTSNFTWQAQFATNLAGPWFNFSEWWQGDVNLALMQPTIFLRLVGFTNPIPREIIKPGLIP